MALLQRPSSKATRAYARGAWRPFRPWPSAVWLLAVAASFSHIAFAVLYVPGPLANREASGAHERESFAASLPHNSLPERVYCIPNQNIACSLSLPLSLSLSLSL